MRLTNWSCIRHGNAISSSRLLRSIWPSMLLNLGITIFDRQHNHILHDYVATQDDIVIFSATFYETSKRFCTISFLPIFICSSSVFRTIQSWFCSMQCKCSISNTSNCWESHTMHLGHSTLPSKCSLSLHRCLSTANGHHFWLLAKSQSIWLLLNWLLDYLDWRSESSEIRIFIPDSAGNSTALFWLSTCRRLFFASVSKRTMAIAHLDSRSDSFPNICWSNS